MFQPALAALVARSDMMDAEWIESGRTKLRHQIEETFQDEAECSGMQNFHTSAASWRRPAIAARRSPVPSREPGRKRKSRTGTQAKALDWLDAAAPKMSCVSTLSPRKAAAYEM